MAGFGGFLGGLGTAIGSGINTYGALQQQQMRAAQLAQERFKMQQALRAQQAKAYAGNYLLQAQQQAQQGSPPPPPSPYYQPPGSGAPGAGFAPVNPGAPPIGPGGRPMMAAPAAAPAPSLGGPGAAAMRAPAPYASGYGGLPSPNVFEIARGIALKHPGISPAAVYDATVQTVSVMKPFMLDQYRGQLLQLRSYMDMANVESRIRDLDMKQQQGASRLDVEREGLALREAIAQMRENGENQRHLDSLTQAVDLLLAKAGITPPDRARAGGRPGVGGNGLGQVASAARADKNAKVQSADDGYRAAAQVRKDANTQIDAIVKRHGGIPQPIDPDFPAYTAAANRRSAAIQRMTKARAVDPKLPAWDQNANGLASAAPQSVIPPIPRSLPQGSQWSPSRRMWRDPSGNLYDAGGQSIGSAPIQP